MSEKVDVSLGAVVNDSPEAAPIRPAEGSYDFTSGGLLIAAHGDVVMGHPTEFDKAG
jgi:hypothetical protein